MNSHDTELAHVGRLAPSPTGALHLGHARSFLIAWWHARSRGGSIVLRWEDLDDARSSDKFIDLAQKDLEWLGLDWDGDALRQSQRREAIVEQARELERRGLAYACTCSRADIRSVVAAPHASDQEPTYPGTCRAADRTMATAETQTGKPAGLRFRVRNEAVTFADQILGQMSANLAEHPGDFLILRRDKTPAYQLSVVVDDAYQGVTEVVRGDDLLSSTPRQLALFQALGLSAPSYYHVPLVVDEQGKRLAKRDAARSLSSLRQRGVDPRCIVTWAARSCGLVVDGLATAAQLTHAFDIQRVPMSVVSLQVATLEQWTHSDRR